MTQKQTFSQSIENSLELNLKQNQELQQTHPNIEFELSEELVQGWLFNAILKRFNPSSQEEAEGLIEKKGITCRMITSGQAIYATIQDQKLNVIAQARADYFLVPREIKDNLTETWKKEKGGKASKVTKKRTKSVPKEELKASNDQNLES